MVKTQLLIIGAGPAGYVSAIRAAQLGKEVLLVEKESPGGTCLNVGCIPTKALLSYSELIYSIKNGRKGLVVDGMKLNEDEIYSFKQDVIVKLRQGIEGLLKSNGVKLLYGRAEFSSNEKVLLEEKEGSKKTEISFDKAIISTGSLPIMPASLSLDGFTVDSTYILNKLPLPKRVVIVGAGVIGCELSFILNSMGAEVSLVEKMTSILPTEDRDCSRYVASSLKKKGINVLTGTAVEKIEQGKLRLDNGKTLDCDKCVIAIGRRPNTDGLGLDRAGIKTGENGEIVVDENFQTTNPSIYAIGDVIGDMQLAHYASSMGIKLVTKLYSDSKDYPELSAVPRVTYTIPELSSVGMSEMDLKDKKIDYKVGKFTYAASGKAMAIDETDGMIKVLSGPDHKILGAAVVGKDAESIIVPFTMAIALGLSVKDLSRVIYPHPTLSEMILEACEDTEGRAIHKPVRRGRVDK